MTTPTITTAAVALTTAGLLAGGCTYAALSAQSQLFGKVLIASRNPNEIALTYDDGPNDIVTERLLDVLAQHNVRASFFLIGRYVRQRPQIARAIASGGHLIGNHTMTHPWLAWQSYARIRQELTECNSLLEDTLGIPIRYFRAPHGARRPAVLSIARSLGLTPVQWNILPKDWEPIGAEEITARTVRVAAPTSFSTTADRKTSANHASPPWTPLICCYISTALRRERNSSRLIPGPDNTRPQ
jgi:peptidoglycan/xylan/chitin deacetylase (PgdA/CDA1 family)